MSQKVTPFLWFDDQAEEAAKFYTSIFPDSEILESGAPFAIFRLDGTEYIAFNGGPNYKFTPAISLFIHCETQDEIDYYWEKLSAGGRIVQCGWVTDKFGLSWQVVPSILRELLDDPDQEKADRTMQAMLQMKKLDFAALKKAHAGP